MPGFLDNFEQYFESYVLNTQNLLKGALNKVNEWSYPFEKLSYQNCQWFPCFRICSMARNETQKRRKSTKDILN